MRPTSVVKRQAILGAAEDAFLSARFDAVTMDEIAQSAGVSKQTVYTHFGTKEQLFVELVTSMTRLTGDEVRHGPMSIDSPDDVAPALEHLLTRQLAVVLDPRVLRLRRLVIGEVPRFPDLAHAVYEHGPRRAISALTDLLTTLDRDGVLSVPDPRRAAADLNWLVIAGPVNDAMFLGDDAVPSARAQRAHVHDAVNMFLAALRTRAA